MATIIEGLQDLLTEQAIELLQGEGVEFALATAAGEKRLVFRAEVPETGRATPQADGASRTLAVNADFDAIQLTDLAALVQFLPGASFDFVPPQIPLGSHIALHQVKLVIDRTSLRLSSLTIAVETAQRWELIEETFALEHLLLSFTAAYPLEPPLQVFCDICSTLDIGDGLRLDTRLLVPSLDVSVGLPDDQEETPLAPLLGKVLPDAVLEDFTLTDLHAEMSPREQSYAFRLAVEQSWPVIPGVVTLTGLGIELEKSGVARPTGTVRGSFALAGVELFVSASRSGGGTAANPTPAVWIFEGGTKKGEEVAIGALLGDLTSKLGVPVPAFIDGLVLESLSTKLDQSTEHFSIRSEWKSTGFVAIDSRPSPQVPLGHAVPPNRTLIASFSNPDGESVSIKDMVAGASADLAEFIPAGLTVTLNRALYASWQPSPTQTKTLFGVDVGAGLDLSQLPLVGQNFPPDLGVRLAYTITVASLPLTQQEVDALIPLFKAQGVTLGKELLPQGLTLRGELAIGDFKLPLSVPVKVGENGQIVEDGGAARSGMEPQWFKLQMALGPVSLERVGVKFDAGELWVLLDAALTVGPLSLGLSGLSVSAPVTMNAPPTFRLDGLALDYRTSALEIGGSLLRRKITVDGAEVETYDGLAVLKAKLGGKALALSAIAGYASFQGEPSLFLYGVLGIPIGGPPFFSVEGLAAGFGVNRALKVPTVDKIKDFPLVKEAMGSIPDLGDADSRAAILQEKMAALSSYITPELGAGFLAVGVKFTSFKIVQGFALLTVSLGERFELHVLGLARLTVPFSAVDTGVDPIASMEMAVKASFLPEEGFLGVEAQLTPDSFILSRDCKLTGGFAFYTWFAGEHAGDFVITMGGYHPRFRVPEHYPRVPRLGYNWRIGPATIKGQQYFALCAHAVMAGGSLQVSFESGDAHASFRASADFLIGWKPYHYDIELRVGISAGYGFLGDVDVSAGLRLWGPEFGGYAEIDVFLFSFTIEFGDQSSRYPKAIDWADFESGFLPPAEEICSIAVTSGLTRRLQHDDQDIWVVNPRELALATNAFVPTKQALQGEDRVAHAMADAQTAFGIRPMAVMPDDLATEQWIKVTRLTDDSTDDDLDVTDWFVFSPVARRVPAAVWGEANTVASHPDRILPPRVDEDEFVEDVVTGFEITLKAQPAPSDTEDIRSANLQYDTTPVEGAYQWELIAAFQPMGGEDDERLQKLRDTVDQSPARDQILAALGFDPARDVSIDPDSLARAFVIAPQVQQQ